MKYLIFLAVLFCLCVNNICGQTPVSVAYKIIGDESSQLAGTNDFIITISGDLTGKKIILREHIVSDGTIRTQEVPTSFDTMNSDSLTISVTTQKEARDSIKIDIQNNDMPYYQAVHFLPTTKYQHPILMETILDNTLDQENTPIFAYTPGIPKDFNINGKIMKGEHYCDLRDSNTHPALWYEKFEIKNYIYYSIEFR